MTEKIRISHKATGELIAEGAKGWGMFYFEGNYYIASKNLKTRGFRWSGIPGICFYKFIYFWYHLHLQNGEVESMIGWKYWVPNPLFPFIAFRIALPAHHPSLTIEIVNPLVM